MVFIGFPRNSQESLTLRPRNHEWHAESQAEVEHPEILHPDLETNRYLLLLNSPPKKRKISEIKGNKDFNVFLFFLDFEVWVKDFKVFDLRFKFLVKSCIYFSPGTPKTVGTKFNNRGGY